MKYSIYHLKTNEILNHFTLIFLGAILHTLISPNALSLACVAGGLRFWGRREKCFSIFLSASITADRQQRRLLSISIYFPHPMYEVLSFIYRESKKMKFNLILMKTNLIVSASLEDDEIF